MTTRTSPPAGSRPLTRRKIVAGMAGALAGGLATPALAQFGFSFGGGGGGGKTIDLGNIFDAGKSLWEGFSLGPEDEIEIGEKLYSKLIDQSGGQYANKRAQKGLQMFFEDLTTAADRKDIPWEVTLINNNTLNAWALPGGKVGIYKGLLRHTANEDELAAVFSHELGHVELSHGLAQMKTKEFTEGLGSAARAAISAQGSGGGVMNDMVLDAVQDKVFGIVTTGYSRDREFEADLHILKIFEKTGHDPAKADDFFNAMLQVIPKDSEGTTSLYSTHPGTQERIERLQQAAQGKPAPAAPANAPGFAQVKRYFPTRKHYRQNG